MPIYLRFISLRIKYVSCPFFKYLSHGHIFHSRDDHNAVDVELPTLHHRYPAAMRLIGDDGATLPYHLPDLYFWVLLHIGYQRQRYSNRDHTSHVYEYLSTSCCKIATLRKQQRNSTAECTIFYVMVDRWAPSIHLLVMCPFAFLFTPVFSEFTYVVNKIQFQYG